MRGIAIAALLAVVGVALWKHKLSISVSGQATAAEAAGIPGGVSQYTPIVASQSEQQVLASRATNKYAVCAPGYAPAFGPDENQPQYGETLI